ncbi:hypothetical protein LJC14_06925 [Treponema sp. OttesenSCG-928-L16]|nr:hypothetical protein [Treponema sp. OttesenSCG-928-L16]
MNESKDYAMIPAQIVPYDVQEHSGFRDRSWTNGKMFPILTVSPTRTA